MTGGLGAPTTGLAGVSHSRVLRKRMIAEGTLEIVMTSTKGEGSPSWEPGGHVTLWIPGVGARTYSQP